MSNGNDLFLDNTDTFLEALAEESESRRPGQRLVRRPGFHTGVVSGLAGLTSPNPFLNPLSILFSEAFGIGEGVSGGLAREETVGAPLPTQRPLDVTDPSVQLGDVELTPNEKFLRLIRRVGRATQGAAVSPAGPSSAGIERMYEEGLLAPPANDNEAKADVLGLLLAGVGVTLPLGLLGAGRAAARTGLGAALTGPPSLTATVASSLGRIIAPATRPAIGATQTAEAIGSVGFDVLLGSLFGVGEVAGREALGKPVGPADYAKAAATFGAFAGGIGLLLRAPTALNIVRASYRLRRGFEPDFFGPIAPGDKIGERVAVVMPNGRVRWHWAAESKNYDPKHPTRFASPPDPDELAQFNRSAVDRMKQQIERSPEAVKAKEVAQEATPADPRTVPPGTDEESLLRTQTLGSMYYLDRANWEVPRMVQQGKEALVRSELNELKLMWRDPALALEARETVGARIMAIERALGEPSSLGLSTIEPSLDAEAIQIYRSVFPKVGAQETLRAAARLSLGKTPELVRRVEQLIQTGLPKGVHDEIRNALDKVSRRASRGFKKGEKAILEGKVVQLLTDPEYGLTQIETFPERTALAEMVNVERLNPIPKGGQFVVLKNGRIAKVEEVNPRTGEFVGLEHRAWAKGMPLGARVTVPFSEIQEIAASRSSIRSQEARVKAILEEVKGVDVTDVPATPAVTVEGEPVTVVGIGEEAATVRTRTGREKLVRREELRRSTRTKPEPTPEPFTAAEIRKLRTLQDRAATSSEARRELGAFQAELESRRLSEEARTIVDFAPGTVPDPGHKILYFQVSKRAIPEFERMFKAGELTAANFPAAVLGLTVPVKSVPIAHVLPQPTAEGFALYAIEVPGNLLPLKRGVYSELASKAVNALGKPVHLDHYYSPVDLSEEVIRMARIYRAPESLQAAGVRPIAEFASMSATDQMSYLRNLLTLNESVPSEVAKPLAKSRAAQQKAAKAMAARDGAKLIEAQKEQVDAKVEATEELVKVQAEEVKPETDALLDEIAAEDPNREARTLFEREGLTPETQQFLQEQLDALPVTPIGEVEGESSMAWSSEVEGQRLFITKREQPALVSGRPVGEIFYELEAVTPDGTTLEEATIRLQTPEQVIQFLRVNGYEPTLYKSFSGAEFVHAKDPGIVASVGTTRGVAPQTEVGVQELVEPKGVAAPVPKPPTDIRGRIIVQVGKLHRERTSNQVLFRTHGTKTFSSAEEAEQFVLSKGFVRKRLPDETLVGKFKGLPAISTIQDVLEGRRVGKVEALLQRTTREKVAIRDVETGEILRRERRVVGRESQVIQRDATPKEFIEDTEERLGEIIQLAVRTQLRVPTPLRDYAREFSKIFYERFGYPAFNKEIRGYIGQLTVDDVGPRGLTSYIDVEADVLNVETALPAEAMAEVRVKLGKSLEEKVKSADKLTEILQTRPAGGFAGLENTYGELVERLGRIKESLAKSKKLVEVRQAEAELRTINRAIPALEKLRLGIRPTAVEIRNLPATEEIGRALVLMADRPTATVKLPRDFGLVQKMWDGDVVLLDAEEASIPTLKTAQKITKAQLDQTTATETVARGEQQSISGPHQFATRNILTARYKPTGQIVEIIGGQEPVLGPETRIRFPSQEEVLVDTSVLEVTKAKLTDAYDYSMAEYIQSGKYAESFKSEPPFGMGVVEQELGLLGTNDRSIVRGAFVQRADELSRNLLFDGNVIQGGPMEDLLELYRRAQWLDVQSTFPGPKIFETKGIPKISEAILDVLGSVNKDLPSAFRTAAYFWSRRQLGGHSLAELQSRAFAGILDEKTLTSLRKLAEENGISMKLPDARLVAEIAERRLLNPWFANIRVEMKKDAGFFGWFENSGISPRDVEIKIPRRDDIGILAGMGLPHKVARKHPLARMVLDLINRAGDHEKKAVSQDFREFLLRLRDGGIESPEDFKTLKELARKHETWAEAATAGVDNKWQRPFETLRNWFHDRWEDIVRQHLARGTIMFKYKGAGPKPTDPALEKIWSNHREAVMELGLDPDGLAADGLVMPKHPEIIWRSGRESLGLNEEVVAGLSEPDIESFLQLQRQYPDAISLPDGVKPELRDIFDVWKRYRKANYWPDVLEGNIAVEVERGGKPVVVGFVQTYADVDRALQQLIKDGKVGATEKVAARMKTPFQDDILVNNVPNSRQAKKVLELLTKEMDLEPDDVQAFLFRAERPVTFSKAGLPVHAKPRVRDLGPVFEDPQNELAIYNARLARAAYTRQVKYALQLLQDHRLDKALSERHGTVTLNGIGDSGMPQLRGYMLDWIRMALGERGGIERGTDRLVAWMDFLGDKKSLEMWVRGEFSAGDIAKAMHERRYAGRKLASEAIAFQSVLRLGAAPASALINLTQYLFTVMPQLARETGSVTQALKIGADAWIDGFKIWWAQTRGRPLTKELQEIATAIDETGVRLMPSKYLAGTGRSFGDVMGMPPTGLEMGGRFRKGQLWARYYTMRMFNTAEQLNRYGAAVAGIKIGRAKGASLAEQIEIAARLNENTNFRYDELSMPQLMAKAGPVGRVVFQFKPFLLNLLSYEKDMFKAILFDRDPAAIKQLALHLGTIGFFGGLSGLATHPAVSLVEATLQLVTGRPTIDHLATRTELAARRRRRSGMTPEEIFMDTMHYQAEDLIHYGVPGLFNIAMGQRLGVSGQELLLNLDSPGILGPHFSIYADFFNAWRQYLRGPESAAAVPGGLIGATLPTLFPALRRPLIRAALTGAGGILTSIGSNNPFYEWLKASDEGHRLYRRDIPTVFRNLIRAGEIFFDGATYDVKGRPHYVPAGDATEELIIGGLGFPTIRREETNAVNSILNAQRMNVEAGRYAYTRRIAQAVAEGDMAAAYEALYQASEEGVEISEAAIQREFNSLTQEATETIRRGLPTPARTLP